VTQSSKDCAIHEPTEIGCRVSEDAPKSSKGVVYLLSENTFRETRPEEVAGWTWRPAVRARVTRR